MIQLTAIAKDQRRELIGIREDNLKVIHAREDDMDFKTRATRGCG